MSPQAEEIEYEGLPGSAGHGVHMFAGAMVSLVGQRNGAHDVAEGEMLTD
jgi:hypothetical protein